MIFVATGIHEHGFDRLVKTVDELVGRGIIDNVFIQIGYSDYQPQYCQWARIIGYKEFEQQIEKADIVVTHGGAGCIAGALEREKPVIVVPRLSKYNEHNNDHQLELSSELEREGRVLLVRDIKYLGNAIEKAKEFEPKNKNAGNRINDIIREYINKVYFSR